MAGVTAVMSGLSLLMGYDTSQKAAAAQDEAAREAEEIGAANRAAQEAETAEGARRLEAEQLRKEAASRAKAGASGTVRGSMETSIAAMMGEHGRELGWMKTAGASRAELITKGAAATAATGRAQADITRAKGTASLLTESAGFYEAGKKADWWGGKTGGTP